MYVVCMYRFRLSTDERAGGGPRRQRRRLVGEEGASRGENRKGGRWFVCVCSEAASRGERARLPSLVLADTMRSPHGDDAGRGEEDQGKREERGKEEQGPSKNMRSKT